jgi:hypothetical protein
MTQDEYYDMRILLEKWVFHKGETFPDPFGGVGIKVAKRAGWYVYQKDNIIHVYDGPVQHYGMDRLFSCDISHIDGIIAALRMSQQTN